MLHIPQVSGLPVLEAALRYARGGMALGPLRQGTKDPGRILGKSWHTRTSTAPEALETWLSEDSQLGIFGHMGPSLGLAFDVDRPEKLHPALAQAIEECRPPFQATRLDEPGRGHHIFSAEREYGNGGGKLGNSWGEVRGRNGIIVLEPTIHESRSAGGQYRWIRTGDAPLIPGYLDELLPHAHEEHEEIPNSVIEKLRREYSSASHPGMMNVVLKKWRKEIAQRASRHETTVTYACMGAREAMLGYYPLATVMLELKDLFVASMGEIGRGRTLLPSAAVEEWLGIERWAISEALHMDVAQERARIERRIRGDGPVSAPERSQQSSKVREYSAPPDRDEESPYLPPWFWDARPSLSSIRSSALSRFASPDAVFYSVLCRMASVINHRVRVQTSLSEAPLNIFVIMLGASGDGKTQAIDAAEGLVPTPYALDDPERFSGMLPLGSGEGIAEHLMGTVQIPTGESDKAGNPRFKRVRQQVRHNISLHLDEGHSLSRQIQRPGTTIGGVLRSAWSSAQLGQTNAQEETRRLIPAKSYSCGLSLLYQPEMTEALFSDDQILAGTPQRFLWCKLANPDIPGYEERSQYEFRPLANLMHVMQWGHQGEHLTISIPETVDELIVRHILARRREEISIHRLDAHWTMHCVRISAHLALLEGRIEVTVDDWNLAWTIWRSSCASRATARGAVAEQGRRLAARRREAQAQDAVAAREAIGEREGELLYRRVAWILGKLSLAEGGRLEVRVLGRSAAAKHRPLIPAAIEEAERYGWIERNGRSAPHDLVTITKSGREYLRSTDSV